MKRGPLLHAFCDGTYDSATLDLEHNRIGDEDARTLAQAMEKNATLTTLDLWDISIGDEGDEEIRLWLEAARSFSADVISLAASLCSLAGSVDAAIGESEERLAYRHILRSGGFAGEA